jgi:hypothetical protein
MFQTSSSNQVLGPPSDIFVVQYFYVATYSSLVACLQKVLFSLYQERAWTGSREDAGLYMLSPHRHHCKVSRSS